MKIVIGQKVKLKSNVSRGSLLSCSDEKYEEFIDNIPSFGATIQKLNENNKTVLLAYNTSYKYFSEWFYQEQLDVIHHKDTSSLEGSKTCSVQEKYIDKSYSHNYNGEEKSNFHHRGVSIGGIYFGLY